MEQKPLIPENINLNTENVQECIKTMTHWGENVHNNICNGTTYTTTWGSLDYVAYIGVSVFIVIFLLISLMALIGFFRAVVDY